MIEMNCLIAFPAAALGFERVTNAIALDLGYDSVDLSRVEHRPIGVDNLQFDADAGLVSYDTTGAFVIVEERGRAVEFEAIKEALIDEQLPYDQICTGDNFALPSGIELYRAGFDCPVFVHRDCDGNLLESADLIRSITDRVLNKETDETALEDEIRQLPINIYRDSPLANFAT